MLRCVNCSFVGCDVVRCNFPFHNIALYYKSPLALLHGELIDTTIGTAQWHGDEAEAVSQDLT